MCNKTIYFSVFALFLLFTSCSGTKKFAKQASEFESAGMYQDAAKNYLESVRRDPNNIEARVGLKKNGEKVFQDYLDDFFTAKATGDNKQAVYVYLDAQKYAETLNNYNIELEEPSYIKSDFEVIKGDYLESQYNEGKVLMGQEDYKSAERIFAEILTLDPNYNDVSDLKKVAYVEPYYKKASEAYTNEEYAKAYYLLDKVVAEDPNYKDTKSIREECLELGTYTIALIGVENVGGTNVDAHKIQATLLTALTNSNNPFIKIIDRENMESILEQQRLNLSGAIDENTAATVGELLGAKAVLSGKLIERILTTGETKVYSRVGYEAYSVKQVDQTTQKAVNVTKYKKVKYKEYFQVNEVKLAYQIQVTSLETGEIIFSKIVDQSKKDNMHFALYDGNNQYLYPEYKGNVSTSRSKKNALDALLGGERELKATTELMSELLTSSTNSLSNDIINSVDRYISQ